MNNYAKMEVSEVAPVTDEQSVPTPRFERGPEYRIPRSHSPVNSRRFPETFGDFCNSKTGFLHRFSWRTVFSRFPPVDFRRKPEPIPRTQSPLLRLPTSPLAGPPSIPASCPDYPGLKQQVLTFGTRNLGEICSGAQINNI